MNAKWRCGRWHPWAFCEFPSEVGANSGTETSVGSGVINNYDVSLRDVCFRQGVPCPTSVAMRMHRNSVFENSGVRHSIQVQEYAVIARPRHGPFPSGSHVLAPCPSFLPMHPLPVLVRIASGIKLALIKLQRLSHSSFPLSRCWSLVGSLITHVLGRRGTPRNTINRSFAYGSSFPQPQPTRMSVCCGGGQKLVSHSCASPRLLL